MRLDTYRTNGVLNEVVGVSRVFHHLSEFCWMNFLVLIGSYRRKRCARVSAAIQCASIATESE